MKLMLWKIMVALFSVLELWVSEKRYFHKDAISIWGYNRGQGQRGKTSVKGLEGAAGQVKPLGKFTNKQPHISLNS